MMLLPINPNTVTEGRSVEVLQIAQNLGLGIVGEEDDASAIVNPQAATVSSPVAVSTVAIATPGVQPIGGSVPQVAAPVTNWNTAPSTAGAPSISNVSNTPHATPTIVQAVGTKNDLWWLLALVFLLFYFEWRK